MFTPSYIALDFETALLDGSPSVEFYRHDFRATSCAFAWRREDGSIKAKVTWGEDETREMIRKIISSNMTAVVFNYQFEYGVLKCRFPEFSELTCIDVMRLAQCTDNGGAEHSEEEKTWESELLGLEGKAPFNGLSLEACVSRFCDSKYYKHKQPYIDLMIERGGKKGDFHLLTPEELIEYNLKDAEVTLVLYENLVNRFAQNRIDWSKDHYLYRSRCQLSALSKIRGVKVDFDQINRHIELEASNIDEVQRKFSEVYRPYLDRVEARKAQSYIESYKSEAYKIKAREAIAKGEVPEVKMNFNSCNDKEALFVEEMGLKPKFFTPSERPSFSSKLLWQYGEAGLMLASLGTHRISKTQAESLKILAEYDGRWHISMRAASTRNNRMSGGGSLGVSLNPQGLNRRNKSQQTCIVADEGKIFVMSDAAQGEPTVTAYYSKDRNYNLAAFGMVGKRPYYNEEGLLIISDIYLMTASRFPSWKDEIRNAFENYYDGVQGYDLWITDPEYIQKKVLKKTRGLAKILALGIAYSMGPKKMVLTAQQNGYELTEKEAKDFKKLYKVTYPLVGMLEKKLQDAYSSCGVLQNDFGYCLYPDSMHKVLNSWIQSSVAGIIDLLALMFFERCPEAEYVVNTHDELCFQIPIDKVEEIKQIYMDTVKDLNKTLGWDVPISFGWEMSNTWYIGK